MKRYKKIGFVILLMASSFFMTSCGSNESNSVKEARKKSLSMQEILFIGGREVVIVQGSDGHVYLFDNYAHVGLTHYPDCPHEKHQVYRDTIVVTVYDTITTPAIEVIKLLIEKNNK